jgi:hypothetical protein
MSLRRFMQHIKEQNRFDVGLDVIWVIFQGDRPLSGMIKD